MFDETLRIELAPLDVKVLTVVTGSIETNIQSNAAHPALPPSSHYRATEKWLDDLATANFGFSRMKGPVFAEKVVGDVLAGATGKIWRGDNATVTRYGHVLLPMSVQVSLKETFIWFHVLMANSYRTIS
jgi:hypothetical protein